MKTLQQEQLLWYSVLVLELQGLLQLVVVVLLVVEQVLELMATPLKDLQGRLGELK